MGNMLLPYDRSSYYVVERNNVEELIKSFYGHYLSLNADLLISSGSGGVVDIYVENEELSVYDFEDMMHFRNTGEHINMLTEILLNDMCNMGLIIEGFYLIEF